MKFRKLWAIADLQEERCFPFKFRSRVLSRPAFQGIAIALGYCVVNFPILPVWAGGVGGAWSGWLPTNTLTAPDCVAKAQQVLNRHPLKGVGARGLVAYGDVRGSNNISVFMMCSALGDQLLILVTGRGLTVQEDPSILQKMETLRARIAKDFAPY